MEIEWGMTHRVNLLGKNAWKNIDCVQKHFKMLQMLYNIFSQKIMGQLYEGFNQIQNQETVSIQ